MSKPGFRFSDADAVVIAVAIVTTWLLLPRIGTYAWIPVVGFGHFFLFCNVFRVRRRSELIWAAVFVLNFGAWTASGRFAWSSVLLVQTPLTITVIVAQIRSPRYRGVFARAASNQDSG